MISTGSIAVVNSAQTVAAGSDFTLLWTTLPVIGAILLGAVLIAYAKRWRQREETFHYSTNDELAHFRALYERGELSAEEYGRIQRRLSDRLKKEMNVAAKALPADSVPPQNNENSTERTAPPPAVESNGQPPAGPNAEHLT